MNHESSAEMLLSLEPADVGLMSGDERVDLIVALERLKSRVDAVQQLALAGVIVATESTGVEGDLARHEVGAALHLSPGTAYDRTRVAADLTTRLPATLDSLWSGDITYLQAKTIAAAVRDLPDDCAAKVEARVLAGMGVRTLADTRRAVARAVIAFDPKGAADRHEDARARRRLSVDPLPDAMAGLWAEIPAPEAQHVWVALTDRARRAQQELRRAGQDDPGMDALRVDSLVALITGRIDSTPAQGVDPVRRTRVPRCRCGGRASAAVVIDLPTLLGLADNPGELPGYGPIPADLARELAADSDWSRWTTDPGTRQLIDVGATRYRPGRALTRFLAAAHPVCGFPGCNRPSAGCDGDHVVDFTASGLTTTDNVHPECRQHHNAKTHEGWQLDIDPQTGIRTWTSPLGKTYLKPPDQPLPP